MDKIESTFSFPLEFDSETVDNLKFFNIQHQKYCIHCENTRNNF